MGVGRLVSSPLASLRLSADSRDRTKVLPYNDSGSHRAAKYVDELRPSGRKQKPEVGKSHDVERPQGMVWHLTTANASTRLAGTIVRVGIAPFNGKQFDVIVQFDGTASWHYRRSKGASRGTFCRVMGRRQQVDSQRMILRQNAPDRVNDIAVCILLPLSASPAVCQGGRRWWNQQSRWFTPPCSG
jgi:hypothetical protein